MHENITDVKLIASYGFDSTTGQNAPNVEHINNDHFLESDDSDSDSDHDDPFSIHLDVENYD
ncbi:unnamed protein product [Ceratitis capitata]|uniref:(Mediterranean fruit fly) hypothetical protein n=1 Tax=Ceratitis capitata TaxID=7213 RepID=A0A811UPL8_CERCA|nr:unnamed protein product [Ceratitis capitata]